ncbi:MAG: CoxG family protein, partial [Aestuariivirgaceae bacterium]
PAPREVVWAALNDPAILKQSIAGCTKLEKTSATEFAAKVTAKVGPVKANFAGDVKLSKLKPPRSYVISGQGKGGAAGFAKGGATVKLDEKDGQTLLTYDVDAQVGGKLAQIGSRLVQSTARKMADDFFKKFAKLVTAIPTQSATKKTAAKKASAKKTAAKKTAAKKTAAKKTAVKKTAAKKSATKKSVVRRTAPRKSAARNVTPIAAAVKKATDAKKAAAANASPVLEKVADTVAEVDAASSGAEKSASSQSSSNTWWLVGGIALGLLVVYLLTR